MYGRLCCPKLPATDADAAAAVATPPPPGLLFVCVVVFGIIGLVSSVCCFGWGCCPAPLLPPPLALSFASSATSTSFGPGLASLVAGRVVVCAVLAGTVPPLLASATLCLDDDTTELCAGLVEWSPLLLPLITEPPLAPTWGSSRRRCSPAAVPRLLRQRVKTEMRKTQDTQEIIKWIM